MKKNKKEIELIKKMGRSMIDYDMVQQNDVILVAVSGGKDSISLLNLLYENQKLRIFNKKYKLVAYHLSINKKHDPFELEDYCKQRGIEYHNEKSDLHPFIKKQTKKNPCYLCSQIRRKWIFDYARKNNINKIALGHTIDDIVTTSLMNIFYHRNLASQLPKLPILDNKFTIIRPLAYIEENQLRKYVEDKKLPVFKLACLIGDNKRRKFIQKKVDEFSKEIPNFKRNVYAAFRHPSSNFFLDRFFSPPDHKGKGIRP